MKPSALDKKLCELKQSNAVSERGVVEVKYALRGDPLENARLPEITRVVRRHFPNAVIIAFWSSMGVRNAGELRERLQGVNCVQLSLDAHHYAGLRRIVAHESGEKGEALRKKTLARMIEHANWAAEVAEGSEMQAGFSITGAGSEARLFTNIAALATRSGTRPLVQSFPRAPGGCLKNALASRLVILHDCTVTDRYPE